MKSIWTLLPVALAAAAIGASCGPKAEREGPTTPDVVAATEAENPDGGGVSASKADRVLVCHVNKNTGKLKEMSLPAPAVANHLKHGDTLGACPGPCPCFSSADIQEAASQCSSGLTPTCALGDPYYLYMACLPGGNVPVGALGVYFTQVEGAAFCARNDILGDVEPIELTDVEHQACVQAINDSGYCPLAVPLP